MASNDPRVEAGGQEWDLALLTFGQQQTTTRHLLNLFVALEADAWGELGVAWGRVDVTRLAVAWRGVAWPNHQAAPALTL